MSRVRHYRLIHAGPPQCLLNEAASRMTHVAPRNIVPRKSATKSYQSHGFTAVVRIFTLPVGVFGTRCVLKEIYRETYDRVVKCAPKLAYECEQDFVRIYVEVWSLVLEYGGPGRTF